MTVAAAILALCSETDELRVLSLGMGTKVVDGGFAVKLRGSIIRDMHAEVLAKRGFQRHLLQEILSMREKESRDGDAREPSDQPFVLQSVIKETAISIDGSEGNTSHLLPYLYSIRPHITLHMWTSSVPCGNASIRRWAKSSKTYFPDLPSSKLPPQNHEPLSFHARREGQVSVLVKTERKYRSPAAAADLGYVVPSSSVKGNDGRRSEKRKRRPPCEGSSMWIAATEDGRKRPHFLYSSAGTACAPVCSKAGTIMSCSDKIAKWNALGLQGSVASGLVRALRLTSVTIGRKFSFEHCRRALCCRIGGFEGLRHPVLMETTVPLDDESVKVSDDSGGAHFDERALEWVRGDAVATVIDGSTGAGGMSTKSFFAKTRARIIQELLTETERRVIPGAMRAYLERKDMLLSKRKYLGGWLRYECPGGAHGATKAAFV